MPSFDTPRPYPYIMPAHACFFTKGLTQTLTAIEYMASPKGTSIKELSKRLSITRRSVFRLIKTIEHDFNIPVIVDRKTFGGIATYRIPEELIEKFSNTTTPPLILSFRQAILFHLILNDEIFRD